MKLQSQLQLLGSELLQQLRFGSMDDWVFLLTLHLATCQSVANRSVSQTDQFVWFDNFGHERAKFEMCRLNGKHGHSPTCLLRCRSIRINSTAKYIYCRSANKKSNKVKHTLTASSCRRNRQQRVVVALRS